VQNNGEAGTDCGGSCALKCTDGTPCSTTGDCSSAKCWDGFCCNTACTGSCTACDVPGKEGTCTQVAKGHDDLDSMCSGTMTCKNGACVSDVNKSHFGEMCQNGLDCFSGICAGIPLTCQ
jgi:hypothetical protein